MTIAIVAYEAYKEYKKMRKRSCRRFSVRELYGDRNLSGFFERTFKQLKEYNEEQFYVATTVKPETFDVLLNFLKEKLTKTSIRTPISPECRPLCSPNPNLLLFY